tara:strand:- start:142 stop:297 length:156 start_codon:yes stop_codon:yes gene_type:complete
MGEMGAVGETQKKRIKYLDSPQPIPADGILLELGSGGLEQVDATGASVSHG